MNSFNCERNSSTSKKQRNRTKNKRLQGYETSQGTVSIYCSVMVMLLHVFDTNTNSIIIMVLSHHEKENYTSKCYKKY